MHYIDYKYVRLVSGYLTGWKDEGNDVSRFRCPYCGDSQRKKSKRRGYLYPSGDGVAFFCHNCTVSENFTDFLEYVAPELLKQYKFEKFVEPKKRTKAQRKEANPEQFRTDTAEIFKKNTPESQPENKILKRLEKISSLPEDHQARKFLDGRMIPKKSQNRLWYTSDVNIICRSIERYKERKFKEKTQAIVIPFFDQTGILMYLQCRFLDAKGDDLRYMTFEVEENSKKIYGLDTVDWSKNVWVFEGPFDSMFLENSIAVAGVSLLSELKYLQENAKAGFTLVFDQDYKTNPQVFGQFSEAIRKGLRVVIFDKHFPGKDANAAIESGWNVTQLEKYLTERTHQGLKARLALSTFKPPRKTGYDY